MGRRMLALLAGAAVVLGIMMAPSAPAARAATFDPGNIISDALFYDGSAMTAAQIQSFLDSKIGTCNSSNCINILRTSVSSRPARVSDTTGNTICDAFTGGTNLRISDIIYRAQVACGISAKVILVTLQKEQGLVTSKSPSAWNLDHAMGQACPDTAPCDPAYAGIGVQIIAGTTQLKTYKAANFARQPGTYDIQYNPKASCGTMRVTIRNYATAALYNYTPYTPNAAALRNLNGTGDSCSSYGNRNFWRDYTAWFGSVSQPTTTSIDTVPHLLALDSADELWAYPSNGKSGWLARVSLGKPAASGSRLVSPGDLDGDGHRDLISVTPAGAATLHRGDGGLGHRDAAALADWSAAKLITAAGDFSGDGIPDVFTTTAGGDLLLWRGTGGRAFREPLKVGKGWGGINLIVGAGDLSGDGNPDLLARTTSGALMIYRGNGRSGWSGSGQIGKGWGSMSTISVAGDVTGDRRPDVLATKASGDLWLYPGGANGSLTAGKKVGNGWAGFSTIIGAGPPAAGLRTFPAGIGDVDGNATPDLVALTSSGQLRLYRGNGNGGFGTMSVLADSTPAGSRFLPMGDFDGDGVSDLGMIDSAGRLLLRSGDGAGGFGEARQIGNGWSGMDSVFGGIDFDGDRKVDIIARDSGGHLRLYPGDGAGGFGQMRQIGNGWSGMTAIFAAGDFDGDRFPDLIARRADGTLHLYPTSGAGTFLPVRQIGKGWGAMTAVFSPGDFDGSGGTDIIARRADGILMLYSGNGRGGFSKTAAIGKGWNGITWVN